MTSPEPAEAVRAGDRACGPAADEAAIVKRTLAAAYRQAGTWLPDVEGEAMISLADQVEAFEPGDACCPCCEEVTCDTGCPLEPVRRSN